MSKGERDDLVVSALEAVVNRLEKLEQRPAGSAPVDALAPEALREKIVREIRGLDRPKPPSEIIEGCASEDTGATFDIWVESGVVKELRNYRHDPRCDAKESAGGLVPERMALDPEDKSEGGYGRWLSNRWREDLSRFVGKPPRPSMVRDARERATKAA